MNICSAKPVTMGSPLPRAGRTSFACRVRWTWLILLASFSVIFCTAVQASAPDQPNAVVTVSNGDFSNPSNNGSIGGGVVGGSGGGPIGSGPWAGSFNGVAALLAPPTLTIGGGTAKISGLVGLNVGGILNNDGRFRLDTGIAWEPNRRYTLEAVVDTGSVLSTNILLGGNAGIAPRDHEWRAAQRVRRP